MGLSDRRARSWSGETTCSAHRGPPCLPSAYRTRAVALVPILAVPAAVWLMLNLPAGMWVCFGVWMAVELVVYFAYTAVTAA